MATTATETRTLSALFDSQHDAEKAVDRLVDAGIARDRIRLMPGYESDTPIEGRSEQRVGFFNSLANFFFPDDDRSTYAEGLSRGGYLVAIDNLNSADHDVALDILDDEGTIDMDEREANWRSGGWDATASAATTPSGPLTTPTAGIGAEPLAGETLSRRDTSLGRPRVRSYVRDPGLMTVRPVDVEIEDERRLDEEERLRNLR